MRAGPAPLAPRLLLLNGQRENLVLAQRLAALGYDVVADTASPEQALSLAASVVPDAVLVVLDSLEQSSALSAIHHLRDRYPCAVIVLTGRGDAVDVDQLHEAPPHGVVPWPVADAILDVSIKSALSVAAERRKHAASSPALGAAGAPDFQEVITLAAARGARSGLTFAVGAVDISPARPGLDFPQQPDLVAEAAQRLRDRLRQTDVVVRRGSHRLAFLTEQVGPADIESLCARLLRSICDRPQRGAVAAVPTIGMALWKSADDAPGALLAAAEQALAEAKRAGAFRWRVAGGADAGRRLTADDSPVVPSAEPAAPHSLLQRLIGGLSLATLLWVLASYAGFIHADRLAERAQQLIALWK